MKNIFLSAALVITTASAILIVAHAHQGLVKKYPDWDLNFDADTITNHSAADLILTP
ncbi:hypothetical protein [Ferruginibacter sp. SUN106]|uniref:hypothetical protein n=1 Tax=Ferruginibacter sp. SUN106 TaxID=2978348 RepID=UPI003D35F7C8